MSLIPAFIEHPKTLVVAALVCLAALPAIARYFFDDFDSFKRDLGLDQDNSLGRWSWLLGGRMEYTFDWRAIGFVGVYAGLVAAVYQILVKLEHWFH